ncbi:MAG: hypothetical protein A2864_00160 [Candidatus Woykebacteria bacterium RIFCSPHIGHO2_01_FULL_39_12]|uniref:HAD family hydrolase n=1 Tax=Candidatus Woykebacteria bacterium RIFCSPHIGHO2_01_FULL_39_12 TaxID=1802599 RepID=A0A1G1WKV4_9BACT|nr:MAG: hypothetical protein A2864_00160 [Candidatus Woykebacteria bacterium RIFCSPHIGHO2_01_FULL_39_12]
MLKAVLFDFDGTIADSLHFHLMAWRKTFNHYGKNLSDEEIIRDAFYVTEEEFTKKFKIDDVKAFFDLYYTHLSEVITELKLHENLEEVLSWLKKKNIKLAIISFADREYLVAQLSRLKIANFFDAVLGHRDASHPKPHSEIAKKAMKILEVNTDETLLIGDTELDIKTGKNALVLTGLYLPKMNLPFVDEESLRALKADFEFGNFSELPDKVSRLL